MKDSKACCDKYERGMAIINHYCVMASIHSWAEKYPAGYEFNYCPYCGKKIKVVSK